MRESTHDGIGFSKLLPTLVRCQQWKLLADIIGRQDRDFELLISPADRLTIESQSPPEFDSEHERRIAQLWKGAPVEGWQFSRDQDFLVQGQQVFTPDFALSNNDGETIYIEVVDFWTPVYLQEKYQRLEKFANSRHGSKSHGLLMFDRPPAKAKEELFESLRLPSIVLSKNKKPTDWIRLALKK